MDTEEIERLVHAGYGVLLGCVVLVCVTAVICSVILGW